MPRTENQKAVAAYLPLALYEKLEEFKLEEDLKSDSKAINTILERWLFGEVPIHAIAKTDRLEERLSEVERICERLVEQVVGLSRSNTIDSKVPSTIDSEVPDTVPSTIDSEVPGTVPSTIDSEVPNTVPSTIDLSKGISQRSLARRLNCSHAYIGKLQKLGGLDEFTKQSDPDKLHWELRGKKYYPTTEVSSDRVIAVK